MSLDLQFPASTAELIAQHPRVMPDRIREHIRLRVLVGEIRLLRDGCDAGRWYKVPKKAEPKDYDKPRSNKAKSRPACKICGKECARPTSKFCSKECLWADHTKPRPKCKQCDKPVLEMKRAHCSHACALLSRRYKSRQSAKHPWKSRRALA